MLLLNADALKVLGRSSRRNFEDRLIEHLREFFSTWCMQRDYAALCAFIHSAVDKASIYGIVQERDVAKFVDLMVALNPTFDVDPNMSWVRPLLTDTEHAAEDRLEAIYQTLLEQAGLKTFSRGDA